MTRPLMALLIAGCAKSAAIGGGTTVAATGSVYLRSSFDADASPFVGRFVPTGANDIDETAAMPLACSEHITWRFVEGGGVRYTELFQMSTSVAARYGVPVVAQAKANAARSQTARVEYELTGKLVAEVKDPSAFQACCEAQPAGCSDRYIGEFVQGTGRVYRQSAFQAGAQGEVTTAQGSGGLVVSHGTSWEQAVEFPNPVYFAFKLTETPYKRVTSTCGDWVDSPPVAESGAYYVGLGGRPSKREDQARNSALRNAMQKAWMAAGGVNQMTTGDPEAPVGEGELYDPVGQWAAGIEPREWCVETVDFKGESRYVAKVLGWLPPYTPPL